ncbi:MAG TPA: LPXTG cell wall anchor domain-containing protein [Candidatus Saccharimonadales bacterium]|nr:LPXTG cell wall anchor domain-containing protein [Candidatus Saccharimonadales bacterium]
MHFPDFIKRIVTGAIIAFAFGVVGAIVGPQPAAHAAANVTFLKSADKSIANPGDVVTYTLTMTNSGDQSATGITVADDLADVIDDATYNNDAHITSGPGTVQPTGPVIGWNGDLNIGQTAKVVYTVTVKDPAPGNANLVNKLVSNQGNCQAGSTDQRCAKTVNVSRVIFSKTADTTTLTPGSTVHYTITVTSNGTADAGNVGFTDDLSQVLDDATLTGTPAITGTGQVAYNSPNIVYSSNILAVGQSATITYSVTVGNPPAGNGSLSNTVVSNQGNCKQGSTDATCKVQIGQGSGGLLPLVISKSVNKTSASEGDQLTYTITVTNPNPQFTDTQSGVFTDNASDVYDDASHFGGSLSQHIAASTDHTTNITTYTVTDLPGGMSETATYFMTVNTPDTGNKSLYNFLSGLNCTSPTVAGCSTTTPVTTVTPGSLQITHTASPSQGTPGSIVTYTITAKNNSTTSEPLSLSEDLSNILDDGTLNTGSTTNATITGSALTWSATIPAGQTVTASYAVTLKPVGSGNGTAAGTVVNTGTTSNCDTGSTDPACTATATVVPDTASNTLHITQSVSPASGAPGDELTFTITAANTGTTDIPLDLSESLADILDDASVKTGSVTQSVGAAGIIGSTFAWTATIPAGQTATASYTVTLKPSGSGNASLIGTVVESGSTVSNCDTGSTDGACTVSAAVRTQNGGTNPGGINTTTTHDTTADGAKLAATGQDGVLVIIAGFLMLLSGAYVIRKKLA